jgi:hypothetical protein
MEGLAGRGKLRNGLGLGALLELEDGCYEAWKRLLELWPQHDEAARADAAPNANSHGLRLQRKWQPAECRFLALSGLAAA